MPRSASLPLTPLQYAQRSRQVGSIVRTSHMGYDCYRIGSYQGPQQIRCILRESRVPSSVEPEIRPYLPRELIWPEDGHPSAHLCIDAIVNMDLSLLAVWLKEFPGHVFGYETFLRWASKTHRLADRKLRNAVRHAAELRPTFRHQGRVTHRTELMEEPLDYDCRAYYSLVSFEGGERAICCLIRSPSGTKLSKVYIDLVDESEYDVEEHFPGRYEAEGIPTSLLRRMLGISRRLLHRRRTAPGYAPEGLPGSPTVRKVRTGQQILGEEPPIIAPLP